MNLLLVRTFYTVHILVNKLITLERVGILGSMGMCCWPVASQNPFHIITYSVASCRFHLSPFWANVVFPIPIETLFMHLPYK